ncbi:RHS repeat protein [Chitinivorax sp. B]|uniref:RHS repeat protein n=1 Tax=Chitinivorax sp. B TaxID=2502235 RepID=UPI0014858285|nr:RHS repeat protein [Chitinivorax sp. B]
MPNVRPSALALIISALYSPFGIAEDVLNTLQLPDSVSVQAPDFRFPAADSKAAVHSTEDNTKPDAQAAAVGDKAIEALANPTPAKDIADFYRESGHANKRDAVDELKFEEIDPLTGALRLYFVDAYLPGTGGLDIKVIRSLNTEQHLGAMDWQIHFGRLVSSCSGNRGAPDILKLTNECNPTLHMPDGSSKRFAFDNVLNTGGGSPAYLTNDMWRLDVNARTVQTPDGLTYTFGNGFTVREQRYNPAARSSSDDYRDAWSPPINRNYAYVSEIRDRNGNWIKIDYSTDGTVVTASDGRSITLAQVGGALKTMTIGNRVWQYQSNTACTFGDGTRRQMLSDVIRPDGTRWHYSYFGDGVNNAQGSDEDKIASACAVASITNPFGGVTNYEYGYWFFSRGDITSPSGRFRTKMEADHIVVKRKTTSDGGEWKFNAYYGQNLDSSNPAAPGRANTRTVTTPSGVTTYTYHAIYKDNCAERWKIGLLLEKEIAGLQKEIYEWVPKLISHQLDFEFRTDEWDTDTLATRKFTCAGPQTFVPVLASKTIIRDGKTYKTSYSDFDAWFRPQTVTETGDFTRVRTSHYATIPGKWLLNLVDQETIANVGSIVRTFDGNGNQRSENRFGVTTATTYHSTGDIETITDPNLQITRFSNYKAGLPQTENRPAGVNLYRVVDEYGNVTRYTDGNGNATGYSYDGLNRLTGISFPKGNPVSIHWQANQRTLQRGPLVDTKYFDGFGRVIKQVKGGVAVRTEYDVLGRKTFQSNPYFE